ncbi:MAG: hypothetical protein KatS3mg057_0940 [Herpetosiphonaceae bacterium]|nr:MAG: hypothetical protein KatS3mg057_0940 [Herpetosiphonaceae bacterium]
MAAVLYEPAFATLARWFIRYRRRALTLLTLFGGLASVIFTPLTHWLIERYGWRDGVAILALILGVVTVPLHGLILRSDPREIGALPDGIDATTGAQAGRPVEENRTVTEVLRELPFWALTGALTLNAFCAAAISVHLIPYLISSGYEAGFAAAVAGLVGAMQLPGRLLFAPLGRGLEQRRLAMAVFAGQGGALLILSAASGPAAVIAFVIIFGMSNGMTTLLRAALVAELYGAARYGSLSGVISLFSTSARALAPIAAGLLYTLWGGYRPVLWLLCLIALAALLPAGLVTRRLQLS